MKIELENAIKVFHPNPSYEQVYFEAVANSLDANANEIAINIFIESFDKQKSLEVIIQDNGDGFTDKNFSKFSKLLKVDNAAHKGLGRLVYLAYFSRIEIESIFEEWKRSFVFNSDFDGENQAFKKTRMKNNSLRQTILKFSGYFKEKVYTYDFLNPQKIKESLLRQFFPLFFSIKESGRDIKFSIGLKVDFPSRENNFYSQSCEFSLKDLPELKKQIFKIPQVDLIQSFDTYYSIEKNIAYSKSLYTAVCVDNRAIPYELISIDAIPDGYQVRFLFMSEYFIGKTNTSRQKIDLPDEMTERQLREYFRQQMGKIIDEEIPDIAKKNGRLRSEINKNYPHLDGYISDENVGLIQKSTVLEEAQKKFFNDQRTVLDCEHLNEDQYFKALELSSRTLAEYVIYRARIISKLKTMTLNNSEKEIHELIVPTKTTLRQEKFDYDIFNNNVWMLDDKYMSYNVILSDEQMKKLYMRFQ